LVDGAVQFNEKSIQTNTEMQSLLKMIATVESDYPYLLHLDPAA